MIRNHREGWYRATAHTTEGIKQTTTVTQWAWSRIERHYNPVAETKPEKMRTQTRSNEGEERDRDGWRELTSPLPERELERESL